MAEILTENQTCAKCGSDIRENTQFCYNCGMPIAADGQQPDGEQTVTNHDGDTKSALDELAARFKIDEAPPEDDDKLARAAEKRKKARVERRKPREYRWEAAETISPPQLLLLSILVGLVVLGTVLLTVWIR